MHFKDLSVTEQGFSCFFYSFIVFHCVNILLFYLSVLSWWPFVSHFAIMNNSAMKQPVRYNRYTSLKVVAKCQKDSRRDP